MLQKITWLLALSAGISGCATRVDVIAGAATPRRSYGGNVALKFLEVPPSAVELARVTVTTSSPDIVDAVQALLARTALLGGNLAKLDELESDTESTTSLGSDGKFSSGTRLKVTLRGRAFYLSERNERAQ